ncbi:MAG: hypothetical protein SFZ23_00890 [Planctomycetota bacterium]|nr:hypothetical protein [Planctomycetota bacterium]
MSERQGTTPRRSEPAPVERLLRDLISAHEKLLEAAAETREGLRRADSERLRKGVELQSVTLQRIAELEHERRQVFAAAPTAMPRDQALQSAASPAGATRTSPTPRERKGAARRIADLASEMPEPQRATVLSLGTKLRELITQADRDHEALALALKSLSAHVEGLLGHAARAMGQTGVYTARGCHDSGRAIAMALDLRS